MGWTGGYVLLALLLAPYLRKFGKFTVPDFIGDRYYSNTARVVAVVCAIFVSFTYVAGQMRGVGIVFSRFLEVDINLGVIIGMAIVFFYAVLGGMKGITYTQVAQYCVLIFAYLVPAIFISLHAHRQRHPAARLRRRLVGQAAADPARQARRPQHGARLRRLHQRRRRPMIDVFCITLALMVGTAGLPHVIVRFFTVPKVRDARRPPAGRWSSSPSSTPRRRRSAAFARYNLIDTINGPDGAGALYERGAELDQELGEDQAASSGRTRTATAACSTPRTTATR